MSHPSILVYKQTLTKKFPLILIIGREPNNSTNSDNTFGEYQFESFPKCAFWNLSFGLLASYNSLSTNEIKQEFQRAESSPIIFSDASPKGIPNSTANKRKFRAELTKSDFDHQINMIFNSQNIVSRVELILLSGLTDISFQYFVQELSKRAANLEIPVKPIPFLFGNNFPKIKQQITEHESQIFKKVFKAFRDSFMAREETKID